MNKKLLSHYHVMMFLFLLIFTSSFAVAQGDVTFQVNMKIKMMEGTFQPENGDIVTVPGTFNNWNANADTLTDGDGDSIYTKTVTGIAEGNIDYKFYKTLRGGISWESDPNRSYTVVAGPQTIPVDYFDRDSVYDPPSTDVPVTFQVNMKVKMLEDAFKPLEGDIVTVPGSFNGWDRFVDTLSDDDGDSIYTKTVNIAEGATILYKFWKTLRSGSDWESDPNREYTVPTGGGVIPVDYFDRDTVVNPPTVDVPVTFQINMSIKMLEGTFQPDNGDIVSVPGSFNGWNTSANLLTDDNGDSIYTTTVMIMEGQTITYKFYKTSRGGLDWEGNVNPNHPDGNRVYEVPQGGGTIPPVYFNNDSVYNFPISANVLWQVNMSAYSQLGWFRPDLGDSMQVRGGFNSWGGTVLEPNTFNPDVYEVLMPYSGTSYDDLPHKFYIDFDSAHAVNSFPGWNDNRDERNYEHPSERGDGNRIFNVGTGGNVSTEPVYYSGINPQGLLNAGDTVTVKFTVNMGPATRQTPIAFVPGTDTVKLIFQDGLSRSAQAKIQGSFFDLTMTPVAGGGDTIYEASFNWIGPAHYNILYVYRYVSPGGSNQVEEGAGLGAYGGRRSRFIQPNGANSFPRNYNAPMDSWQRNAPLPLETPPFTTDILPDENTGAPVAYKLMQNYPNPFNPATRIRFTIPERAHVTLKVYNILGQEVATLLNEELSAGNYVSLFEANTLSSGVYFYKLQAGSFSQVKKMLLMK